MTEKPSTVRLSPRALDRLVIVAQGMALLALALCVQFLINTTGGTLFVFSTVAPVLTGMAVFILVFVAALRYRRSLHLFEIQQYEPGEVIFRQGDAGLAVYFIRKGAVEVIKDDGSKSEVVANLTAGQYFGEMALLSNEPRNATIRTTSDTELAALGKRNFSSMLSVLPSTEEDILKTIQARATKA